MGNKWADVDLPVLRAIDRLLDAQPIVHTRMLPAELGLESMTVQRSVRRLFDAGFIDGVDATAQGEHFDLMAIRLLERGLEAVGAWPSDAYDRLLEQVADEIESTTDQVRKSRLAALRDGIAAAGREIAVEVLAEWAKRVTSGL